MMWLVFASVLTLVFAPIQETVQMAQIHVLTGPERRRRFSLEEKRRLVGAAFAPGAVVSEVARRADVCASLIYRWRRELGQAPGGFAELIVAPMIRGGGDGGDDLRCLSAPPPVQAARPSGADVVAAPAIEIELAGSSRVRIPASMPPDLAAAVIAALRRR
jgi:transposase